MKAVILSRQPSHRVLRRTLPEFRFPCVIRLGSVRLRPGRYVEVNSPSAVRNAANKLLMKRCFDSAGVATAPWWFQPDPDALPFPVVAKHIMGSRGTGVYLLRDRGAYDSWLRRRPSHMDSVSEHFIFEQFRNYGTEYRLHVWEEGCFYTNRKALLRETPDEDRWKFNHCHTVWLREDNPEFRRPRTWDAIEAECVKAMRSCGLQFGACDVKVNRDGRFFLLEINSAPSFGDITAQKYTDQLPRIAARQHETAGLVVRS